MMEKKSCNCIEKIKSLKKDIERLTEENLNFNNKQDHTKNKWRATSKINRGTKQNKRF